MNISRLLIFICALTLISCTQFRVGGIDLLDNVELEYYQSNELIEGISLTADSLQIIQDQYLLIKCNSKIKLCFDQSKDTLFFDDIKVRKLPLDQECIIPNRALRFYFLHFDSLIFQEISIYFEKAIKKNKLKLEYVRVLNRKEFACMFDQYTKYSDSSLPVIRIDTDESVSDQSQRSKINIASDNYNYLGECKINVRGQTSKHFHKKSFKLTLIGAESNQALLGMPKEHNWVLHGPYVDISLMRNKLAYQWARDIGMYAPRLEFCELIVNKEYLGIYLLCEKIKRDRFRVDVVKRSKGELLKDYIIKIDKGNYCLFKSKYRSEIDSGYYSFYQVVYPKKKNLNKQDIALIQTDIFEFEESLMKKDDSYLQHINLESFVDFFIINEMCKNIDAYRISTYMYKKENKLFMGPVWDFNYSLGLTEDKNGYDYKGWVFNGEAVPFWWDVLFENLTFRSSLRKRWKLLRENQFSDKNILETIKDLSSEIEEVKKNNFLKWDVFSSKLGVRHKEVNSYQEEIYGIEKWISQRLKWMDEEL